jgi:hypothetical protein
MLTYDTFMEKVEAGLRRNVLKRTAWFRIVHKKHWEYLYEYIQNNTFANHAMLSLMLCPREKDKKKSDTLWSNKITETNIKMMEFNSLVKNKTMRNAIISAHLTLWRSGIRGLNPEYEKMIREELGI